jgi:hypothetical protein
VRTVVQSPEDDHRSGGKTLDSVALFGGKVYWITRAAFVDQTGTVSSYDLFTGVVADVPLGVVRDIRTSAAGLTWVVEGTGRRAEVKIPASLPAPVAAAVGAGQDQVTLVTDGTAYAWATGVDQGGIGVAWWSPNSGLVRVTAISHRRIPRPLYGRAIWCSTEAAWMGSTTPSRPSSTPARVRSPTCGSL